jgi:hypothetical protein
MVQRFKSSQLNPVLNQLNSVQKRMIKSYNELEVILVHHLSKIKLLRTHFENPVSQTITTIGFIILLLILIHKVIFQIGVHYGVWEIPGKEYFVDKPVHCAHVYVHGYTKESKHAIFDSVKLKYHIEFSPEEYHQDDPDLGSTLGFLRRKLYFLFKDSELYSKLDLKNTFTINDVIIYDVKGNVLEGDLQPLCLLGVETGHKIKADFNI